jgi:hypothetical protein
MLIFPSGVKIDLALGHTDKRKGFDSVAVVVQRRSSSYGHFPVTP